jgi:hypothetical protein
MEDLKLLIPRLEGLSIPEPMSGCRIWLGSTKINPNGIQYGRFSYHVDGKKRTVSAHRISFRIFRGPIPAGLNVCHSCDLGLCIEPAHLFAGTQRENIADCLRKGRRDFKLSRADVATIRRSSASNVEIAELYDINYSYVCQIRSGDRRKIL